MNTDYKTMLITGTTQGIGYQLYKYYKDKYNIITINRQDIGDNTDPTNSTIQTAEGYIGMSIDDLESAVGLSGCAFLRTRQPCIL